MGGGVGRIEPLGRYPFSSAVYVIEIVSPSGDMYSNDPLTASPAFSSLLSSLLSPLKVLSCPDCCALEPSPDM